MKKVISVLLLLSLNHVYSQFEMSLKDENIIFERFLTDISNNRALVVNSDHDTLFINMIEYIGIYEINDSIISLWSYKSKLSSTFINSGLTGFPVISLKKIDSGYYAINFVKFCNYSYNQESFPKVIEMLNITEIIYYFSDNSYFGFIRNKRRKFYIISSEEGIGLEFRKSF
jgi:hypothetical protein